MAHQFFAMFLCTRHQTVVIHVLLELRDIGIENFQILSMLFSNLHFVFTRTSGCFLLTTTDQKVNFSPSACLLRLFESLNDYNDQYHKRTFTIGMGSFVDFVPV